MKHTIRLALICILFISAISCKSKKSTATASATTSTPAAVVDPAPVTETPATPEQTEIPPRFVVEFYSIGEGIDGKTLVEFENFIKSYPVKIAYTPENRGREGETNYNLALNELSAEEQVEFIKKARVILEKSKLVHIKENINKGPTRHPPLSMPTELQEPYRLVVQFYSIGEGIDFKTKEDFDKFLSSYTKKVSFEPVSYGREGEIDYCLKLNELSVTEQADFVKKAKEFLSKSKLVHVNENASCVHKH